MTDIPVSTVLISEGLPLYLANNKGEQRTFLSKCLSNLVSASVSPPGQTAEGNPSVSKPIVQTPK